MLRDGNRFCLHGHLWSLVLIRHQKQCHRALKSYWSPGFEADCDRHWFPHTCCFFRLISMMDFDTWNPRSVWLVFESVLNVYRMVTKRAGNSCYQLVDFWMHLWGCSRSILDDDCRWGKLSPFVSQVLRLIVKFVNVHHLTDTSIYRLSHEWLGWSKNGAHLISILINHGKCKNFMTWYIENRDRLVSNHDF